MGLALLALGLVLVAEGLLYALAPSLVEDLLAALRAMTLEQRRLAGLLARGARALPDRRGPGAGRSLTLKPTSRHLDAARAAVALSGPGPRFMQHHRRAAGPLTTPEGACRT